MLELDALSKSFAGRQVVAGLSFRLQKGDVLGFLGQNGAGKSTTMRMVAGVLEPDSGDARIMGQSILGQRQQAQAQLGYLPEGAPLYNAMSVLEYLRFLCDCHAMPQLQSKAAIERVLADTRISDVSHQILSTLSKGFRRRVALAGALIHDPPILLLDEPMDGLDPIQKQAMRALIARMAHDKAILISTHTLEDVQAMCSRLIILEQGRIIADDTPEVLAAPFKGDLEAAFIDLSRAAEQQRGA